MWRLVVLIASLALVVSDAASNSAAAFGRKSGAAVTLEDETSVIRREKYEDARRSIKRKQQEILDMYDNETVVFEKSMAGANETVLVQKFLRSIATGADFTIAFAGGSYTAGHDCYLWQSYPSIVERAMWGIFAELGVELSVLNRGMGGTGTLPYAFCMEAFVGNDADIVAWEFEMNDAGPAMETMFHMFVDQVPPLTGFPPTA